MNPNFSKRIGVLVATALLAAAGCSSSDKTTSVVNGTFTGTVKDSSSGSALAGVTVTPTPANGPAVVTDSKGKYSMPVVPGTYTLTFTADNYNTATLDNQSVAMGATSTVDKSLDASPLKVTVNLPAALKNGGPSGFNTAITGITVSAKLNGNDVTPDKIAWTLTDYYGLSKPPDPNAALTATDGATTGFSVVDFETLRKGANDWLNIKYGTVGTPDEFEYVQAPERDQLLSFGVQQVRAMSYKVIARVTSGGLTSTGSAIVSPVTISNGGNTQPLGMMVVGNAPSTATYAWTLKYLPTDAAAGAAWGDPPAGVTFQGANTKNPTVLPTVTGVFQLANGTDAPISFRVSTYHGVGTGDIHDAGDDGIACSKCHDTGSHSPMVDKFAEWSSSPHANFNFADATATPMSLFKAGLDGLEGSHYSESCIQCHVVGYNKVPTAQNNGFDDVMAKAGWKWPVVPEEYDTNLTNWNALPEGLQHRGSIQCENCHGPLEPADHSSVAAIGYSLVPPMASMNAGICLYCHDALSNHDKGPLWASSGHANEELAMDESVIEGRGTGVENCGRCHSAEGFIAYVAQLKAGAGSVAGGDLLARPASVAALSASNTCVPDTTNYASNADPNCACASSSDYKAAGLPDLAKVTPQNCYNDTPFYNYFKGLGLNKATIHSQTCQTCHDPHSTELRVEGDTLTVAGRFRVSNAGAGALCITCHNSRSGAIKQGTYLISSWSRMGPHTASQGDMFAGRNAFFMANLAADDAPTKLSYPSAHSFLSDTCVDCHVKWVPADIQAQYTPAGTNHTFRSSTQICAECHAADIGERIQESVSDKMATLNDALSLLFQNRLTKPDDSGSGFVGGFDTAAKARTDFSGKALTDPTDLTVLPATVRSVVFVPANSGGTPALKVTLTDGTQFQVAVDKVNLPNSTTAMFSLTSATDTSPIEIAARANFNLLFVTNDGAKGVHNPAFAGQILDNATAAVNNLIATTGLP